MDTIGQTLKKARESKKMTVAEVAHATQANIQYIEAIEAGHFSVFPAPIYAVGFIRLYAECVGLNPQPLMQAYRNREAAATPEPAPVKKKRASESSPARKTQVLEPMPAKQGRLLEPIVESSQLLFRGISVLWQAALKKICWPEFEVRCSSLSTVRLPLETWKTILAVTGMTLLVIVAVVVLGWYILSKNGAETSTASRRLADPPAPYLNAE